MAELENILKHCHFLIRHNINFQIEASQKPENFIIFKLGGDENSKLKIGRANDNQLQLMDEDLSRKHAIIFQTARPAVADHINVKNYICDLSSRQGTCIFSINRNNNNKPTGKYFISNGQEFQISDGYHIQFAHKILESHGFWYKFSSFQFLNESEKKIVFKIYDSVGKIEKYLDKEAVFSQEKMCLSRKSLGKRKRSDGSSASASSQDTSQIDSQNKSTSVVKNFESPLKKLKMNSSETKAKPVEPSPTQSLQKKFGSEFQCCICIEMLIPPSITTNCGHTLCSFCINKYEHSCKKKIKEKHDQKIYSNFPKGYEEMTDAEIEKYDAELEKSLESFPCPECKELVTSKHRTFRIDNYICEIDKATSSGNEAQKLDREEALEFRETEVEEFNKQLEEDKIKEQDKQKQILDIKEKKRVEQELLKKKNTRAVKRSAKAAAKLILPDIEPDTPDLEDTRDDVERLSRCSTSKLKTSTKSKTKLKIKSKKTTANTENKENEIGLENQVENLKVSSQKKVKRRSTRLKSRK